MRSLWRGIVSTSAAFGFLFATVTFAPVLNPWIAALAGQWTNSPGDTLIVLGGDVTTGRLLGLTSYWRAVYAIFEWREGQFKRIVLSGAEVCEPMRDFLIAQGVPAAAIELEGRSTTTRESALALAQLLRDRPGRKVLMTSDYHMFRAYRAFRKAGLEVTPRPFADASKRAGSFRTRWPVFLDLMTETAKIVWYRVHGWI